MVGCTQTRPKARSRCETYAAEWISSLRNLIESNCVFGTYRASATIYRRVFLSAPSQYPATIRIDKTEAAESIKHKKTPVRCRAWSIAAFLFVDILHNM